MLSTIVTALSITLFATAAGLSAPSSAAEAADSTEEAVDALLVEHDFNCGIQYSTALGSGGFRTEAGWSYSERVSYIGPASPHTKKKKKREPEFHKPLHPVVVAGSVTFLPLWVFGR